MRKNSYVEDRLRSISSNNNAEIQEEKEEISETIEEISETTEKSESLKYRNATSNKITIGMYVIDPDCFFDTENIHLSSREMAKIQHAVSLGLMELIQ